jgi:uracil-DNA glycosylase
MLAPPSELRPPVGVPKEGEEEVKEEKNEPPPPPEIQTITIPWIDHELPVPKEEIVVAAGMTAAVSVVATLTATSLFKQVVKILKPVFMQVVKRIQKKLGKDTTGSRKEEELTK